MWVTPLARPAALCCTIHRPRFEPHGRQIWLLELSLHFREKFKSNFGSIDLPHHESSPHLPAVLFQAFGIVQCQAPRHSRFLDHSSSPAKAGTMVLHNPNNWHWVNKDATAWAKDWFEENLTKLEVEDGETKARINKVISMDGDVDVSQRKGKVITIYDVKLVLEYSGSTTDETDVSGTITIPEVAHDTEATEFVFDIDIYSDSNTKQPVKDLVRAKLVPQLRIEFLKLPTALIAEHGKDIQHAPGSNPSTALPTPKPHQPAGKTSASSGETGSATTQSSGAGALVNTTTVTDTEEFRTTAEELFKTFTDPQRLAAFTRAPPKVFEGAKKGGKFELFGGNVSGVFLELEEPKRIVQSWRLDQWPKGHFSKLHIEFDQNDVDSVTVMRVEWTGVPVGQEEVTKRNWDEYYVRSIKRTFGFGTIL